MQALASLAPLPLPQLAPPTNHTSCRIEKVSVSMAEGVVAQVFQGFRAFFGFTALGFLVLGILEIFWALGFRALRAEGFHGRGCLGSGV